MDSLPIISRLTGRDDIRDFGTVPYGPRNAPGKHTPAMSEPRPNHAGTTPEPAAYGRAAPGPVALGRVGCGPKRADR